MVRLAKNSNKLRLLCQRDKAPLEAIASKAKNKVQRGDLARFPLSKTTLFSEGCEVQLTEGLTDTISFFYTLHPKDKSYI